MQSAKTARIQSIVKRRSSNILHTLPRARLIGRLTPNKSFLDCGRTISLSQKGIHFTSLPVSSDPSSSFVLLRLVHHLLQFRDSLAQRAKGAVQPVHDITSGSGWAVPLEAEGPSLETSSKSSSSSPCSISSKSSPIDLNLLESMLFC
jgi:hypothetical protein